MDLSSQLAHLSPEQLDRLRQQLQEKRHQQSLPQIAPYQRNGNPVPLSFAQERLWLFDQFNPGLAAYNIPQALRLQGTLNIAALKQSFNAIIRRHESLRTTFITIHGEPKQLIAPPEPFTLTIITLAGVPPAQKEAQALQLAVQEAQTPFDLSQAPLLRATLFRLDEADHILLLIMHHIISDGWSIGVLFKELTALYNAFVTAQPVPLPELSLQYTDFAVWQRQWLQGETLETQLVYWQKQLDGQLPVLELPTDRPRPPTQTFAGGQQNLMLSQSLSAALKQFSQKQHATLFMTLLAAFKVLLYRYTGQHDLVVGSPVANRNRTEVEGHIGFFLNTLVLRTQLAGQLGFQELLAQVRQVTLGALTHQDVPLEKLIKALQPDRHVSHPPLFQVLFILQNVPLQLPNLLGLTTTAIDDLHNGAAKFDLTLAIEERAGRLAVLAEYNSDLFEPETISRLLGHYQTLLAAAIAQPERPISTLPMLTQAEQRQLLVAWNNTQINFPCQNIIQLFEAQAEQSPQAIAFIFENQTLTYGKLNEQANQLAHYLSSLGLGPESIVGLCLERSLEMVVALFGILKAGAAYLPLDPAYPQERLAFMLDDAQVSLVISHSSLATNPVIKTSGQGQNRLIYLDREGGLIAGQSRENPPNAVMLDTLAYVIYTSGSTGQPKGMAVPHRQINNRLAWMWQAYPFTAAEVGCQRTALNFVDSIWELFGSLLQGKPTVIVPDTVVKAPVEFVQTLADHGVTRLWVVPALLRLLLDSVPDLPHRLPRLKFWVTSGEAIPPELYDRFRTAMPHSTLYNLYGTSEVWDVTWYEPKPHCQGQASVPIGRPIANMQTYILDETYQPVPIGIPGELYVGGVGLARGYFNRPDLTAEKFIPNPFNNLPFTIYDFGSGPEQNIHNSRLYRTGDLARYLPDGNIEFLGRLDQQVKIRGFRIELGEIEAILMQHIAVKVAAVVVFESRPHDVALAAYIVQKPDATLKIDDLQALLQRRLPDYMLPTTFMVLDNLPLTPSGKLNRRALPPPDLRPSGQVYAAPTTLVEEILVIIWAKALSLERVGVNDNFFKLGGHSLLAVQILAQIRDRLGIKLPLTSSFTAPTIAQLAIVIEQARDNELTSGNPSSPQNLEQIMNKLGL